MPLTKGNILAPLNRPTKIPHMFFCWDQPRLGPSAITMSEQPHGRTGSGIVRLGFEVLPRGDWNRNLARFPPLYKESAEEWRDRRLGMDAVA